MPLRVFDDAGQADVVKIARAIRYAARNGANVINLSFGLTQNSNTVAASIDYAVRRGVIVVASAGNNNTSVPQYPAGYPGVLSVAAVNDADRKASFSNYGNTIAVSAPGTNIISAYPGGYFAMGTGTSFASPMVAGEVALILSLKTNVGNSVTGGVVNIDALNPGYAGQLGSGRMDSYKALKIN